jgi:hypothetical protein
MRPALETLEQIDAFLDGKMSKTEEIDFQTLINESEEVKTMFENQKLIRQLIQRKAIKAQVLQFAPATYSSKSIWTRFKYPIILSALLLLGFIGVFALSNDEEPSPTKQASKEKSALTIPSKEEHSITKETDVTSEQENTDSSNNSDPDIVSEKAVSKNSILSVNSKEHSSKTPSEISGLKPWIQADVQQFNIDPKQGKTIECKNGTLIIVPKQAFVYSNAKEVSETVRLEIVEALNMADMLAYNLTTMNDNKALSSGGMIHIQAYVGNEKVKLKQDHPLHIEVPTIEVNPTMLAWKGETNAQGNINWVEPKPLKKFLTPIAFENLDFLPDGFESAVEAGLPFKSYRVSSKALVDSLYYSLGYDKNTLVKNGESSPTITSSNQILMPTDKNRKRRGLHLLRSDRFPFRYFHFKPKTKFDFKKNYGLSVSSLNINEMQQAQIQVSQKNKIIKHQIDNLGNIVVSKLDVINTEPIKLIINPPCSKIETFNNIYLIEYRKKLFPVNLKGAPCNQFNNINPSSNQLSLDSLNFNPSQPFNGRRCYINPLHIKTIKTAPFSNTFLATKEFESRLKVLHQIPNSEKLLNYYTQQLNKNLWEIDQQVAYEVQGKFKQQFQQFADEKLTNVDNDEINQAALSAYYNSSREKYSAELKELKAKNQNLRINQLMALNQELNNVLNRPSSTSVKNTGGAFNFKSNGKLFGSPRTSVSNTNSYKVSWYQTGWVNIDAYLKYLGPEDQIVQISPEVQWPNQRIFQCVNSLKTIVPLTQQDTSYEAHFPQKGKPGALEMEDTYCIGLSREGEQLQYAEKKYNPYQTTSVKLNWSPVNEEELYNKLLALSPNNTLLVTSLEAEKKRLEFELQRREEKERIEAEIRKLEDEIEKENVFINSLIQAINTCNSSQESNEEIDNLGL